MIYIFYFEKSNMKNVSYIRMSSDKRPHRARTRKSEETRPVRLTNFSDYSLRVLMFAGTKGDGLSTIDEISKAYGISRNHLMKVVHKLGQLGYLTTVRGRGGGFRLASAPGQINLGRLIRETEEDLGIVECLQRNGANCAIEPACRLKSILGEALDGFLSVLDRYTLADLLTSGSRLKLLLAIP
jgi:Rrf2 family nitric oxide-sensitive transcriptional repressor